MNKQESPGDFPGLTGLEIAVIGMAGRFPGARNLNEFWENIKNGVESISFFSPGELEQAEIDPRLLKDPGYVGAYGYLEGLEYFDSDFFGYNPIEADIMDPQMRLFHESAWAALEDAGYCPGAYQGTIGLYAGATSSIKWAAGLQLSGKIDQFGQFAAFQLMDRDFLSMRISYSLNLKGPAILVQTACSTSLVAVHLACQAILMGECDAALAGGVTAARLKKEGYLYRQGLIHSPDGHCRAFDSKAKGTVGGDGVGIVVLKRLKNAAADGDHIYALVKGLAVNNDGVRKIGFTAPSIEGQAEVIIAAQEMAEAPPESITYLETHGTGTEMGDPIEIEALKLAFDTNKKGFCAIGSVKTNVGHLDIAAGVTGFIKTVLCIHHRLIPPSLHHETPNPKINLKNSPFYMNTRLQEWEPGTWPLRAGVSSFGIGGTNAHVILEEAPRPVIAHSSLLIGENSLKRQFQLILLSAKTQEALAKMTENLAEYFKKNLLNHDNHDNTTNHGLTPADAAYTLQVGREAFRHKKMLVVSTINEAVQALSSPNHEKVFSFSSVGENPPLVFLFPGQGSQYVEMARGLYDTEPLFREEMDRCFEILNGLLDYHVKEILYPPSDASNNRSNRSHTSYKSDKSHINQTEIAQPLIFIIEYALARLLMSWGITPHAMMGHSIGEYVAACLSGVFSLETALEVVALRGKLMGQVPGGSMLAVSHPAKQLLPLLEANPGVSLAAVNSSSLCTVSGSHESIHGFEQQLKLMFDEKGTGHESRRLHTSHAFHSPMMDPVLEEFEVFLGRARLNPPQMPYISNSTGTWISHEEVREPAYWSAHLRQTVRFADGLEELLKNENALFLEVGPGKTLSTFVRKHDKKGPGHFTLNLIRHPRENTTDDCFLLTQMGRLWLYGVPIDWQAFHAEAQRKPCRISLPPYPFQGLRYQLDIRADDLIRAKQQEKPTRRSTPRQKKKSNIAEWFYVPSWKPSPGPAQGSEDMKRHLKSKWLVLVHEGNLGVQLVKELQEAGQEVTVVRKGQEFARPREGEYVINTKSDSDYRQLFAQLRSARKMPHRVIHLWNVTENPLPKEQITGKDIEGALESGFYSLLAIAREIGKPGVGNGADEGDKVEITVLTNRMQQVSGEEVPEPLKAVVRGAVQVIPGEFPNIHCRGIDIDNHLPGAGTPGEAELVKRLLAELSKDAVSMYVAYRGGQPRAQTFEKTLLETTGEETALLRENGVYLVTGGLGGIGLELAGYLAGSFKARLVLTGRSALPSREEWEEWLLTHDPADETGGKIRKVQQLETAGAEVLVLRADAANQQEMQAAVETAEKKFGPINGIIHAAGLADGGLIQRRTREMSEAVFAPKIKGALVLDTIFNQNNRKNQLDFLVLCSSLSSVSGPVGQAAYCAANAFLDTFALAARGTPAGNSSPYTAAINWDAWQEVGMAAKAPVFALPSSSSSPSFPHPRQTLPAHHPLFNGREVYGPHHEAFVSLFRVDTHWVLDEHRIMGTAALPGTAYLEMARAALENHSRGKTLELRDVYFLTPLTVKDDEEKEVRTIIRKNNPHQYTFSIVSRLKPGQDQWTEHCKGNALNLESKNHRPKQYRLEEIEVGCSEPVKTYDLQGDSFNRGNMTFGPRWNNLKKAKPGKDRALGFLELPAPFAADIDSYKLHPALLDMATILLKRVRENNEKHLPFYYKKIRITRPLPRQIVCFARSAQNSSPRSQSRAYDITITDEQGNELVQIEEYTLKKIKESKEQDKHTRGFDLDGEKNVVLGISSPGSLEGLEFRQVSRKNPGPGEVEIAVYAAGLNFKEVLLALGALGPVDPALTFGLECSGKITACGEGVEDFDVGDNVLAFGTSCFGTYITTPASLVALKPDTLGFEAAAAIPVAFLTAYYALIHMGKLSKGERVLIHSAAGGVGTAAVKIAQWKEAEIFATAGNEEKRAYLRSIGIQHIMDSRNLDFASQIMETTNGKGVDLVLNSLSGEFISKSISLLAPYGRFLEIGIRDMINNTQLGLQPFLKGLSYFSLALGPDLPGIKEVWQEVVRHFNHGNFTPLPYRTFPMEEVNRAFEYMSAGNHIGKIVAVHRHRVEKQPREGAAGLQEDLLKYGISPSQGIEVFKRVLANKTLPQVVVSTRDLFQRLKEVRKLPGEFLKQELDQTPGFIPKRDRPRLSTPYVPPATKTQQILAHIWQEFLGIREIGIHDDFFEIGGDSLKVVTITTKIHKALNVEIPVNEFFNRPTVKTLAEFIQAAGEQAFTPIEPAEKKEYYPLSPVQKRLYILQQMEQDFIGYNETETVEVNGKIDKEKLDSAFIKLTNRHESLRTSFEMIRHQPVQRIHDQVEFKMEYYKVEVKTEKEEGTRRLAPLPLEPAARSSQPAASTIKSFIRPFDLSQAPLLRLGLIQVDKEKHILTYDMHHIITDGTSMEIITKDLLALYKADEPQPLRIQYRDFSQWQNNQSVNEKSKSREEYWLKEFSGEIPVLDLPTDYPRPLVQSFDGDSSGFYLGKQDAKGLKDLALKENATLYMVLLAVYSILLSKVSGQEDMVIGIPAAGRLHADLEPIIGMFVNTLPLRNYPIGEKTFLSFLQEIKKRTLEAFENQEYPLENLVEKLVVKRDASRNPLFDVMFVLRNMEVTDVKIPGLQLKPYQYENRISKFDITLNGVEREGKILLSVKYCRKLFKKKTIIRFIKCFKNIVSVITADPGQRIARISIIPAEEKHRILYEFNDTAVEYPRHKTLHELFNRQVEQIPDHVALVGQINACGGAGLKAKSQELRAVTYSELNEKSNQLAHLLMKKGVTSEIIVGIMVERSIENILGILGILKAGGAYLPIDPDYPRERIDFMLKDSGAKILLKGNDFTPEAFNNRPKGTSIPPSTLLPFYPSGSSNLAYIMYTSGSTGKPKGVLVDHGNVVRLVINTNYVELTGETRIIQTGAPVFDATTFEIWGTLLNGGQLALVSNDIILDADLLGKALAKYRITTLWLTSPLFNQLAQQNSCIFSGLKYLLVGGDILSPQIINKVRDDNKGLKIINGYGPTENTTFSTTYLVDKDFQENIPIGKPISNSTAYILDNHGLLLPIGIFGELWVGGDGVSRGYLNSPGLTAKRFRRAMQYHSHSPHSLHSPHSPHSTIYRTGDLARWLPDGNIEFSGRLDHQVKVRGFRVECGEIESHLLKIDKIKETVVVVKENKIGEKYLCAYIVAEEAFDLFTLRNHLALGLPDYMIPSYFVPLVKMPLTPNGKIDRKALPEPEYLVRKDYTPPGDEIEKQLVKIWAQILGRDAVQASQLYEAIGIYDNFFELGGHSLKAAVMAAKIHKTLNVKITLAEIFVKPTIERLARTIKAAAANKYSSIEPGEEKEYYELSSPQKRLYILQQMEHGITSYHISAAFELEGDPGIPKLEAALRKLIERHESFRTSFELKEIVPIQRIHNEVKFEIEYYDVKEAGEEQSSILEGTGRLAPMFIKTFIRPFDLSQAPLLRVGLIKTNKHGYILMVDMHHIISDGSSMGVFIKDLMMLYRGEALTELRIRYKDYSQWHNQVKNRDAINRQETYWLNQLAGEVPVLNLPLDYPRPLVQSFEGNTLHFEINEKDTEALKSLALKEEVTLFMLLLASINILLAKLSGQEEIIVGMPVAARRHADLQEIIGMFVNTLVLWNKPIGNKPFNTFLTEVKEKTLNAYENQEYPFEDLVEKVSAHRDAGRNPLFDVIFALQNMETTEIEIPGLKLKPYDYENNTSKFDLTITGVEKGNRLLFTAEYCTKLFKKETILRFITYFKNLVSSIIQDCKREISGISFIPEEEKHQVLYEFNDTRSREPIDKTLHELFREQAQQTPDHIAVVGSSQIKYRTYMTYISYRELNDKSDGLAHLLIEKGVKPDTIVAIMVERSIEMIIGLLGILKAGGAYLPIDPDYPEERIDYMLKDSNARLLIKKSEIRNPKSETNPNGPNSNEQNKRTAVTVLNFEHLNFEFVSNFDIRISNLSSSNLSYIIYTSGTTGKPKGNLTTHINVIRVVKNTNYIELTGKDRVLQLSNYAFDGSVFDIYGALLNGSVLVLVDRDKVLAVDQLAALIKRQQITVFFVTTALFNTLIDMQLHCFARIRKVLFGGERVSLEHARKALEYIGKGRVIHVYGPTETTVYATYYFIDGIEEGAVTIPIGLPITDTTAYILDRYLHLVPIGVTGELYIGGQGLARGYLNRPGLTAEKFDHDLWDYQDYHDEKLLRGVQGGGFLEKSPPGRRRLYNTGDLVRRLADGNIEFIGRIDGQIKIRGFRVELGEIEKRLLNHSQIKEAVVIARELGKGNKQLLAYIVPRPVGAVLSDGLRKYLSTFLPAYMIPSYFVELDKLPLTPNGKVDRDLLPIPGAFKSYSPESYAAPATNMEKLIADIWKEMLKLEKVGIDDNFFDIGGNSLNILQVNKKLSTVLAGTLPVMIMFRYPTIRSLAEFFGEQEAKAGLDRKKRAEALTRGKSDRMKRYRKKEQKNRKIAKEVKR